MTAQWMDSRNESNADYTRPLDAAKKLSGYIEPTSVEEPVLTGRIRRNGYLIEKNYIKGEGDYIIPYLLFIPDQPNQKAIIYLHSSGKSVDASVGGEIEWFVKQGFTVLAPDLIGVGEVGSEKYKGDSNFEGNSYNLWFASLQIGRSIVGVQSADVVRITQTLKNSSGVKEIFGVAKKEMAPVLLHAASFDPSISRIALIEPYVSYQSIVMTRLYEPSFIQSTVPAALTSYDLPDLAASLAPKKLLMVNTLEGSGNIAAPESIQEEISFIKTAYKNRNAEGQLSIINQELPDNKFIYYQEWIK
jgi:hypothetical protein